MQSQGGKPYKGMAMEGRIASWYARNTHKDLPEFRRLAERLAGNLPPGSAVLEVAPGPGYLAIELARRGQRVTGLDISHSFVRMATKQAREAGVAVDFRHGNASDMPFPDATFDLAVCRAAFKNFTQPLRAIDELHRVLRPGGNALIVDLTRDTSPQAIRTYVDGIGLGGFDRWMTRQIFRFMLIRLAYSEEQFQDLARKSAFGGCEIRRGLIGAEVLLCKAHASV
jgi:ubiquinone/menaquinone biosynthesis C-methylase UbiE